ncbi:MAG TPA: hypothetical protein VMH05_07165 [Bryobacteraceae bacterium]|nr:hypothetical protein [Bryobacteraceae bacterium]
MTVLDHNAGQSPALFGQDGELVSVCVSIEPRLLEDLLEALAALEFPVNPQIHHKASETGDQTANISVEFPAYGMQLEKIRGVLARNGFEAATLTHQPVLARAQNA